ncbi:short-chain dehydrogenase TIC 32, chloroplastic isoform X2 [Salvia hispanica]|uniref:short-chain dehydrogenase TIC 32, chloroplastic isoform X2 n=1 Tax=Salvia hispanica TaxID=49212 RepID=UPI002009730F|nr:short-chain dehydrogenase TIC 32, chloroplastic isoform X2 [Salvia hispanica]
MSFIYIWISTIVRILELKVENLSPEMKATLKYLAGIAGPSGYGSKTTAQQISEDSMPSSHDNLTAIVTGATSGIGLETARVLAKRGVRVVMPARDLSKAERVKESIQKESPQAEIIILEIDLSSFGSIQRFCSEFLSLGLPLHILINNAGKYSQKLEFSEDKIELTFATNYLGHFLLTEMLLGKMVETAAESCIEGRIVNVSSVIHNWVNPKHFSFMKLLNPKSYNGTKAYAQSKLANILHAKELSRQLKAKKANVTINAVHPGIIKTGITRDYRGFLTGMQNILFLGFDSSLFLYVQTKLYCLLIGIFSSDSLYFVASKLLKSTSQGAATTCYVALSPRVEGMSGKYFADCNESHCSALANDESNARKLWKQTRALMHRRFLLPVGKCGEGEEANTN